MKTTTFPAIVALLVAVPPIAEAQKVTLSSPGERIETLVPKLAAASGANLRADKTTFGEVVILDVEGAELETVKQKIAEVTGFVWVENGETSTLIRSVDAVKAARAQYAVWSAEWMRAAADANEIVKSADEKYQPSLPNNGGRGFLGREVKNAFGLMLRDFDFRQISNMEVGERRVLSTLRTLTQVPFDPLSHRWANKAAGDLTGTWRQMANSRGTDERARDEAQNRLTVGIKKSILVARRTSPTAISLEFQIIGGDDRIVSTNRVDLASTAVPPAGVPTAKPGEADSVRAEMLRAISGLSMDVREAGDQPFLTTQVGSAFGDRVIKAVAEFGSVDPVAWAAGDFFQAAKPAGVNLVACLSDIACASVARARTGGADVWRRLVSSGTDVSFKDGWLVAKPGSTYAAWQGRVDRPSFVRLFNTLRQTNGLLSLDMMLEFVNAQPAWVNGLGSWETALVAAVWGQEPGSLLAEAAGRARDSLAFYWAAKDRLSQVPVIQDRATAFMSKPSLGWYLFNDERGPSQVFTVRSERGSENSDIIISFKFERLGSLQGTPGAMAGQLVVDAGVERTEFLPNGIEFDGSLTVALTPQQSLLLVDGLTGGVVTMSVNDYAMLLAQAHYPQGSKVVDPARYTRMAMIERQTFTYSYNPTETSVMTGALVGSKMAGTIGVYGALPESVLIQIETLKLRYIQELARRRPGAQQQQDGILVIGGG